MGISEDLIARNGLISNALDDALKSLDTTLGIVKFFGSVAVTAGQSKGAAGATVPALNAKSPKEPILDRSTIALMQKYISTFKLPDAATINDKPPIQSDKVLNWQDKTYVEWMFTDLKNKISDGFNGIGIINSLESQIWDRRDARIMVVLTEASERRQNRWSQRNLQVSSEMMAARQEEMSANFAYIFDDYAKDRTITTAELKDASRKFSIKAGLEGEKIYIDLQENYAIRMLEAMEATSKLAVETFRGLLNFYTDVTLQQYLTKLLRYSEEVNIGIETKKADLKRYMSNTRNIISRNKKLTEEFEADTDKFISDSYFNELKAKLNMLYNELAMEELSENKNLILEQIRGNLRGYTQASATNKAFISRMGPSYAQWVAATKQSISLMLQAGTKYTKAITA